MSRLTEFRMRRKWFIVGMAISLSAATFAKTMGRDMEQSWRGPEKIDTRYGYDPDRSANLWGSATHLPWSGPWWWTQSGSVAVRWRALVWNADHTNRHWPTWEETDALTYSPYTAAQLAQMSEEEIRDSLSPIEKLDVIAKHADPSSGSFYSNLAGVRSWVKNIAHSYPEQLGYHGLCHGFSHASIWLPEPDAVTIPVDYVVNGRKVTIRVNFGSGDMKALATYFYGQKTFEDHLDSEGNSIYQAGFSGSNGQGMNAGSFHLLLTNLVGKDGSNLVVDTSPGDPVWNYPVVGYRLVTNRSTGIVSYGVDPRAVREIYVSADVDFMGTTNPTQDPLGEVRTRKHIFTKHYEYRIELDSYNQIVGGSWVSSSDRPDFVWKLRNAIPFDEDYALLTPHWKSSTGF